MKTLILSDHATEKLRASALQREAEYAAAVAAYKAEVQLLEDRKAQRRQALAHAWQDRRILATISALMKMLVASLASDPERPERRQPDREEIVWASGREGERLVSDRLASQLGDYWTLIAGYKNRKGEIDQVLVGPNGVFAIEIKYINGVVHCDGDRWWRDKYDRYGNLVESGVAIVDARGRGPSRQLNESADALQAFLTKRVGVTRVRRAVVFSHESSLLGELRHPTVDCVATIARWDLTRFLQADKAGLNSLTIGRVIQAIQRDHEFHQRPPAQRGRESKDRAVQTTA